MADGDCRCCHGKRVVLDAEGSPRPCSRCNSDAFDRWSDARRPQARKEMGG